MKKMHFLCMMAIGFSIPGTAQNVSISGTVKGGAGVVSGARVTIKNYPHLVAITDASGAFTLSGGLPVVNRQHNGNTPLPTIKNSTLRFIAAKCLETVRIDRFFVCGSMIFSRELTNVAIGSHAVALGKTAQGIHIVRLTMGQECLVFKMAAGGSGMLARPSSAYQGISGKNAAAGVVDSLLVVARGWKNAIVNLPDYNGQVTVTLAAINQWKPAGALVKDKGMVKIMAKGYDFEMGQTDPTIGGDSVANFEQPVHTVSFTYDFWMDTTEVTQKMYCNLMDTTYADFSTPKWESRFGIGDQYPAYRVYWGNGALYCNARSKREGLDTVYRYSSTSAPTGEECELFGIACDLSKNGYRLPTEAEWEYACKGGTTTDFYWGKNYGSYPATSADTQEISLNEVWTVNSNNLTEGVAGYGTHEVASKKPNPYGLYDMAGNVSEHCHDYWVDTYAYGTVIDPTGPAVGSLGYTIRGGNWGLGAQAMRSANRNGVFNPPSYQFFFIGFRTVKPIR